MSHSYIGAWSVFDEDHAEGLDKAFDRYRRAGITRISYAGIAHALPIHEEFYKATNIDPHVQIDFEKNRGDAFGTKEKLIEADFFEIQRMAADYGIEFVMNVTPGVSDVIVEHYPDVAVTDVEGAKSPHWLCPSNPDVLEYFRGRIRDIVRHTKVHEIELDVVSINVYDPQVVPDWVSPELSPLTELAAGSCFCPHCIARAREVGLPIDEIRTELRAITRDARALTNENFIRRRDAYRGAFDIVRFLVRHPKVVEWLNFRASAVEHFVHRIRETVRRTNPQAILSSDLVSPSFSWKLGQFYHNQPAVCDLTKLMLYHKRIGRFEVKPLQRLKERLPEISEEQIMGQYFALRGFSGPATFDRFSAEGLDVENVYYEILKAKMEAGPSHPIIAGLVGDPPATHQDVEQAVEMAHRGGADGYMLHLWYHDAPKENIDAFGEAIRRVEQESS
ncbi:MAG: hypothetical protein MI724_03805 [Spirochaetales bacterium]|nr:hypothetical protein [Spirochaetales bacterium]